METFLLSTMLLIIILCTTKEIKILPDKLWYFNWKAHPNFWVTKMWKKGHFRINEIQHYFKYYYSQCHFARIITAKLYIFSPPFSSCYTFPVQRKSPQMTIGSRVVTTKFECKKQINLHLSFPEWINKWRNKMDTYVDNVRWRILKTGKRQTLKTTIYRVRESKFLCVYLHFNTLFSC